MDFNFVILIIFLVVLITIELTLNKILNELKNINFRISKLENKKEK